MSEPRRVLITLSNPVAGREAEYLAWYRDQHLAEVTDLPGFAAATLFRLDEAQLDGFPASEHGFMCVYELEGEPGRAHEALHHALTSGEMTLPPVIDQQSIRPWSFTEIAHAGEPESVGADGR